MTGMAGDTCFNSRQSSSPLLNSVRDKPLDSLRIFGTERQHFIELAFCPFRLVDAQVAFAYLGPHYFAGSGDTKAFLCPFVSF